MEPFCWFESKKIMRVHGCELMTHTPPYCGALSRLCRFSTLSTAKSKHDTCLNNYFLAHNALEYVVTVYFLYVCLELQKASYTKRNHALHSDRLKLLMINIGRTSVSLSQPSVISCWIVSSAFVAVICFSSIFIRRLLASILLISPSKLSTNNFSICELARQNSPNSWPQSIKNLQCIWIK